MPMLSVRAEEGARRAGGSKSDVPNVEVEVDEFAAHQCPVKRSF
jgi:hypothetical protein